MYLIRKKQRETCTYMHTIGLVMKFIYFFVFFLDFILSQLFFKFLPYSFEDGLDGRTPIQLLSKRSLIKVQNRRCLCPYYSISKSSQRFLCKRKEKRTIKGKEVSWKLHSVEKVTPNKGTAHLGITAFSQKTGFTFCPNGYYLLYSIPQKQVLIRMENVSALSLINITKF